MATVTLWPFEFSTTTSFVIEVGDAYMRFFTNQQPVMSGLSPYEITTPYSSDVVFELQHKQINDVVYICHPDFPVYKLTRVADDNWTLAAVDFFTPAMLDENTTETTITVDGQTGSINMVASESLFLPGHVGSYWRMGFLRDAFSLGQLINGNIVSNSYSFIGTWSLRTYGTWAADILVQRILPGQTEYTTMLKVTGAADRNVDETGEAEPGAAYRFAIENYVSGSATGARLVFESPDSIGYGFVQITAVGSGLEATADVIEDLKYLRYAGDPDGVPTTTFWAEGAWSDVRGYPRALTVHEQRLLFGGTSFQPATWWGSVIDDYENFLYGPDDDDAYMLTLAGLQLNIIQWMVSTTALVIGTSGAEWAVSGDTQGNIITGTRVDAKQQSSFGSEYIAAMEQQGQVLFVQRKATRLREVIYSIDNNQYNANDLTAFASHLTSSGIVTFAFQRDPTPTLWIVTNDGQLLGLTYDREQQVIGWHRHITDGLFESVACIYGDNDADDEVWVVVNRTIGSVETRFVELLNPVRWVEKEDAFYVDCGLTYDGSPLMEFTIAHLPNTEIDVLADGRVYLAVLTDAHGTFILPEAASVVQAGLRYVSELKPFRFDADAIAGAHAGKVARITSLETRLMKSSGGQYVLNGSEYDIKAPMDFDIPDADNPPLLGDDAPLDVPIAGTTGFGYDPTFLIRQNDPLPLSIISLSVGLDVSST